MKEQFEQFMKMHNAHEAFKVAVVNNSTLPYESLFEPEEDGEFLEPCNYISSSFMWADSKEGFKYWNEIDMAWMMYLKNNQ